jgi:hypothetical protein
VAEAEVERFLRKALVDTTERSVEEGRRANRVGSCEGWRVEAGCFYTRVVVRSCVSAREYLRA